MQINVKNPEFLLNELKTSVLNRTHYLVSQGIAYDSDWRDSFVELFDIIDQLEAGPGEKLVEEVAAPSLFQELADADKTAKKEAARRKHQQASNARRFPVNSKVLVGKGKTVWTVESHDGYALNLTREGAGRNKRSAGIDDIKLALPGDMFMIENPSLKL